MKRVVVVLGCIQRELVLFGPVIDLFEVWLYLSLGFYGVDVGGHDTDVIGARYSCDVFGRQGVISHEEIENGWGQYSTLWDAGFCML